MVERTERVFASVTPEFKKHLRIEAAKRGMSMSELTRETLLDAFETDERNEDAATTSTSTDSDQ